MKTAQEKTKKCNKCGDVLPLSDFHKNNQMADGHLNQCPDCKWRPPEGHYERYKDLIRSNNKKNKYKSRHDYNFICKRRFFDMKRRVNGEKNNHIGAIGKEICSQEDFSEWCQRNKDEFDKLHEVWKASGFVRKYAPSIDRIDNDKGYIPENMRWVSVSENAKGGGKSP